MLGSNSLWVFGVSVYLASETPTTLFFFFLDNLFKDVCKTNDTEIQRYCVSLKQRTGMLAFHYK